MINIDTTMHTIACSCGASADIPQDFEPAVQPTDHEVNNLQLRADGALFSSPAADLMLDFCAAHWGCK